MAFHFLGAKDFGGSRLIQSKSVGAATLSRCLVWQNEVPASQHHASQSGNSTVLPIVLFTTTTYKDPKGEV